MIYYMILYYEEGPLRVHPYHMASCSSGPTLAHFNFRASDEAAPMWCRGSFAVRGAGSLGAFWHRGRQALQCRKWTDELQQRPRRTPITQESIKQQSSYRVEHCGDRREKACGCPG